MDNLIFTSLGLRSKMLQFVKTFWQSNIGTDKSSAEYDDAFM